MYSCSSPHAWLGPDFGPVFLEIPASPHGWETRQSADGNVLVRLYFTKFILIRSWIRTTRAKITKFSETKYPKNLISQSPKLPYKMFSPNQMPKVLDPQCLYLPNTPKARCVSPH